MYKVLGTKMKHKLVMVDHRKIDRQGRSLLLLFIIPQLLAWKASEFPNPNRDVESCGRGGVKSWICDPDIVLKKEEADILEEKLRNIHYETDSGCGGSFGRKSGYEIGVALVKNMDYSEGETSAESAQRFAKFLHNDWGVGKRECNDGAVIFLSVNDRQIYISTGQKTKERLVNKQINLIIEDIRPLLREEQYGKALERGINLMKDVLEGRPLSSSYFSFGAVVFWLIFALAVAGIISSYYNQKKYKEFERKLGRIDLERRNQEYVGLLCPICLEDFTPQTKVKLLVCGHKYCERCLSEWLKTKTSCPICRQNVNRNTRDVRPEPQYGVVELMYRLTSLYNQYPYFVSHDTILEWLSPNFQGSFLEDMNQSDRSLLSSNYGRSFGSSSDFGGGSSTSGDGSGGSW